MKLLFDVLLVAMGSALGGLARWGIGLCVSRWLGTGFPWGTFVINISGCLFLGWFSAFLTHRFDTDNTTWMRPDDLKLMIAVGFTGAYTTFSTFELEAHGLFREGDNFKGLTYLLASVVLGLLAIRLGASLAVWK